MVNTIIPFQLTPPNSLSNNSLSKDEIDKLLQPQQSSQASPLPIPKGNEDDSSDDAEDGDESDEEDNSTAPSLPNSSLIEAGKRLANAKANPTPNAPTVSDTLKALLGKSNQSVDDAKKERDALQLGALFSRLGNQFGNAMTQLAPTKLDNSMSDALMKSSQQPMADLGEKQALAKGALQQQIATGQATTEIDKTDPNSAISKAARDFYQKTTGKPADAAMSASDLQSMDPILARTFAAQERSKDRTMMSQSGVDAKEAAQDAKQQVQDEKIQQKFSKDVSGLSQSSRSAIGKAAQAKISVNRLLDIVNDPNSTNQDLQSAYADLNQVVSGTTTMGGTEHQSYSTAFNKLADLQTYFTGNPAAPIIPAIKAHVADVANRMNKISDGVVNKHVNITSAGVSGWAERNPEAYQGILSAVGQNAESPAPPQGAVPGAPVAPVPAAAPSVGPHGNTVVQGGHTYNWNPTSGKYE